MYTHGPIAQACSLQRILTQESSRQLEVGRGGRDYGEGVSFQRKHNSALAAVECLLGG